MSNLLEGNGASSHERVVESFHSSQISETNKSSTSLGKKAVNLSPSTTEKNLGSAIMRGDYSPPSPVETPSSHTYTPSSNQEFLKTIEHNSSIGGNIVNSNLNNFVDSLIEKGFLVDKNNESVKKEDVIKCIQEGEKLFNELINGQEPASPSPENLCKLWWFFMGVAAANKQGFGRGVIRIAGNTNGQPVGEKVVDYMKRCEGCYERISSHFVSLTGKDNKQFGIDGLDRLEGVSLPMPKQGEKMRTMLFAVLTDGSAFVKIEERGFPLTRLLNSASTIVDRKIDSIKKWSFKNSVKKLTTNSKDRQTTIENQTDSSPKNKATKKAQNVMEELKKGIPGQMRGSFLADAREVFSHGLNYVVHKTTGGVDSPLGTRRETGGHKELHATIKNKLKDKEHQTTQEAREASRELETMSKGLPVGILGSVVEELKKKSPIGEVIEKLNTGQFGSGLVRKGHEVIIDFSDGLHEPAE